MCRTFNRDLKPASGFSMWCKTPPQIIKSYFCPIFSTSTISACRKFILVTNNENNIARDVTYPRLKNIINGYSNLKKEKIEGLGGNLLYYTIDFVSADRTDPSLYELATNLVDTICLKENTFEKIKKTQDVHIYNNKEDHYSVIVFNEDKLNTALKELEKTDGSYTFYIFSLGGNTFDEEL